MIPAGEFFSQFHARTLAIAKKREPSFALFNGFLRLIVGLLCPSNAPFKLSHAPSKRSVLLSERTVRFAKLAELATAASLRLCSGSVLFICAFDIFAFGPLGIRFTFGIMTGFIIFRVDVNSIIFRSNVGIVCHDHSGPLRGRRDGDAYGSQANWAEDMP